MTFNDLITPPVIEYLDVWIKNIYSVDNVIDDEELIGVISTLESYKNNIPNSKQLDDLHSYLSSPGIKKTLQNVGISSQEFEKSISIVYMASIIESDAQYDKDDICDLNSSDFKLFKMSSSEFPFKIFGYFNNTQKKYSMGYFDFSQNWGDEISDSGLNKHLIACTIVALKNITNFNINDKYMLVSKDAINRASREAALKLQVIVQGKSIHKPVVSNASVSLQSSESISPTNKYQQFNESIIILSEYRDQKDVMYKYLSLYQVIENFMFRIPIAECAQNNGEMFSIRNFKTLYNKVKDTEMKTFMTRFKLYWNETFISNPVINQTATNKELEQHIKESLASLKSKPGFKVIEFNKLLANLDINNNYTSLIKNISCDNYAHLVYKMRCCIVHNNETEFHLSHYNINETIKITLDEFLIKNLENLILKLIAVENKIVWYKTHNLKLFSAR